MLDAKEIYVLKWAPAGKVPVDGLAFTDKERAERCAEHNNKNRPWFSRWTGARWVVSTLRLTEGPKRV